MGYTQSVPIENETKASNEDLFQNKEQVDKALNTIGQSISRKEQQNALQPKQAFKYTITFQNLKDTFKAFAINNDYLNKDRFNDAIESLFRFPMPNMHYTYLSERIYELLDESGDGKIQEGEFIEGFKNVLTDREFRIRLSMMAMMNRSDSNRTTIEPNEIKEFFFKSWVQGYRHLGWQIKRDKAEFINRKLPLVSSKQLEIWALRYETIVKQSIEADLKVNEIDSSSLIDYETFKKWLYVDHTIYVSYAHKSIRIATNLTQLDDIGFVEEAFQFKKSNTMTSILNEGNNC